MIFDFEVSFEVVQRYSLFICSNDDLLKQREKERKKNPTIEQRKRRKTKVTNLNY